MHKGITNIKNLAIEIHLLKISFAQKIHLLKKSDMLKVLSLPVTKMAEV